MFPNSSRGYGLGLLAPWLRLMLVIVFSTFFILINDLFLAAAFFAAGILFLLLNKRINKALVISTLPVTMILILISNIVFSPSFETSWRLWIFRVNAIGLYLGALKALRMGGVIAISLAWLGITPIPEMYEGLAWFVPAREWVSGILRGIQILRREFMVVAQSLIIRGLKWDSLGANIKNLSPLLSGIIPRIIDNTQKAALAAESHQPQVPTWYGDGTIVVKDLWVRYRENTEDAVKGLSFRISAGEFVYIAGVDGAGKTSLMRAIGGLVPWIMGEMRGKILISGIDTLNVPLSKVSRIARYISPDPFASIKGLTVGQEMMLLAYSETEARNCLQVMGIADLWLRETITLSGGQLVRLVLAGALATHPSILILDSPMEQLDPGGRQDFLDALQQWKEQEHSATILIADPFWRELQPYVTRVLVLHEGHLEADLSSPEFFVDEWLERCRLSRTNGFALGNQWRGDVGTVARLDNVVVELGDTPVLHGVTLEIRRGEIVVIMGPNGSGKTTAMLALAGAIAPKSGSVSRDGRVGYVFQDSALQMVCLTVAAEIAFGPKILGWSRSLIGAHSHAQLEWTGLDPLSCPLDLHPAQSRLLAIAAMNTDVSTMVLDEPTIGLDSLGVQRVVALVGSLVSNGRAVVIITHDQEIARIASRVVVINEGRVVYDGSVEGSPSVGGV